MRKRETVKSDPDSCASLSVRCLLQSTFRGTTFNLIERVGIEIVGGARRGMLLGLDFVLAFFVNPRKDAVNTICSDSSISHTPTPGPKQQSPISSSVLPERRCHVLHFGPDTRQNIGQISSDGRDEVIELLHGCLLFVYRHSPGTKNEQRAS